MDDENYRTMIIIMILLALLPLMLVFEISPLTVLHIYPIARKLKKINNIQVSAKNYHDSTLSIVKPKASDEKFSKMLIHKPPLIFTSVGISTGLLLIHIFSVVRFIQYGDEVLSSKIYHNAISIVHGHGVFHYQQL